MTTGYILTQIDNVTMSGGLNILALQEDDVKKMLIATTHLGSDKVNFQMEQYVFKRRPDGINIINLGRTWEKLLLAARAIAAIEHPQDVSIPWELGAECVLITLVRVSVSIGLFGYIG